MAYLLLLAMTYLGAQASVFFKRLAGESNILGILSSPYLYLGGGLFQSSSFDFFDVWLDYAFVIFGFQGEDKHSKNSGIALCNSWSNHDCF